MIQITEKAFKQIHDIMIEEDTTEALRVFVQGGGCSGFQYGFTLDEEQGEDDFDVEGVLIDSMSMQYLNEAVVDYKEELMGSQFVINNPNVTHTCGCGASFGV